MLLNQTSEQDPTCESFTFNANILPALYFLMFPIALVLNGVAAWVSLYLKSTTTFVVYLKNLVAADLVMTLIIPLKAASELPHLQAALHVLSCRFVSTVFYSTQYTCIALLGFISLDRFFKIMTQQNRLTQNVTLSKVISGSVWVLLFGGSALPTMFLTNKSEANVTDSSSCMSIKGSVGVEFHQWVVIILNLFFWVVSVVIAVCYSCIARRVIQSFKKSGSNNSQGQQKIKLRVFLVVVVFFVSFVPYHIIRIPYVFIQVNQSSTTTCLFVITRSIKSLSLWLANTNICLDPLLYVFLCREFKEKLMSMMKVISDSFKRASAMKAATFSDSS